MLQIPVAAARAERLYAFSIAAQPLAAALTELAEQVSLQSLLYAQKDLQDKTSVELVGRYSLEAALNHLLGDSGLGFQRVESGIVVIRPQAGKARAPAQRPALAAAVDRAVFDADRVHPRLLEEVVSIGTRVRGRAVAETAVPVDIVTRDSLRRAGAELGAYLQVVAPSFNFSRTTISDGTDIVRPATLRGLSPDHLLVLINGKRRHHQAQINIQQVVGRGSSGTDINAIPVSAIERIEVLRDGAAAQYGSDAIAGVINIVLKKQVHETRLVSRFGKTRAGDGETREHSLNTGVALGRGYLNLSLESLRRGSTNRAGVDSRFDPARVSMEIGDAETDYDALFFNAAVPVAGVEAYFFGGLSRRDGRSAGFFRGAGAGADRAPVSALYVPEIYPEGFLPRQITEVDDDYLTLGVRDGSGETGGFDASVTYGMNRFSQGSERSVNVSLGTDSPTSAHSGDIVYSQLSARVDLTRRLDAGRRHDVFLTAGAGYRRERYRVEPGDFASYAYGPLDDFDYFIPSPLDPCPRETGDVCADGSPRDRAQAGMQGYPGFRTGVPTDLDSVAVYLEAEKPLSASLTLGGAGRFERYGKEGGNTTGKLSFHYQWLSDLAIRGAYATGFRVPGLNQRAFTNTFTNLGPDSLLSQTLHADENSRAAAALGAEKLKEEKSTHRSLGLVWQPHSDLTVSLDFYRIHIRDRIVLSDTFTAEESGCAPPGDCPLTDVLAALNRNIGAVQLFTNGIDSLTRGADLMTHYVVDSRLVDPGVYGRLVFNGAVHYNGTEVKRIHPPAGVAAEHFYSSAQVDLTETGQPRQRIALGFDWSLGGWRATVSFNRYGKVKTSYFTEPSLHVDVPGAEDTAHKTPAAWLTDVDIGHTFRNGLEIALGAENLFDVYPEKLRPGNVPAFITGGSFVYPWESTPFGINGAYYFIRLQYSL